MSSRRSTIYDIAEQTGVTPITVSRAFSGSAPVAIDTQRRIFNVAKRLGYRPNRRAQSFASGRTRCIGLLYAQDSPFVNGVYGPLLREIAAELEAHDHNLVLIPAMGGVDGWGQKLLDDRVDGCIVMQPCPTELGQALERYSLPTVVVNDRIDLDLPHVLNDERAAGRLAAEHLIGLGHRSIWYASRTDLHATHYSFAERFEGVREAFQAAGLPDDPRMAMCRHGDGDDEGEILGCGKIADLIRQDPAGASASALIAYDSITAFRLLRHCYRSGVRVPDDLSIITFDAELDAERECPRVTKVYVPGAEMGQVAAKLLLKKIGIDDVEQMGGNLPEQVEGVIRLTPKIIHGDSVAAPRTPRST
ncbi:MAG: LacI family DNA-binding transcriptional regulator [Planctomycetota bacterium]